MIKKGAPVFFTLCNFNSSVIFRSYMDKNILASVSYFINTVSYDNVELV